MQPVVAAAAAQVVVAGAGTQPVVGATALEVVVATATEEPVLAATSAQHVVTAAAAEHVVAAATAEDVVTATAHQDVVATGAGDRALEQGGRAIGRHSGPAGPLVGGLVGRGGERCRELCPQERCQEGEDDDCRPGRRCRPGDVARCHDWCSLLAAPPSPRREGPTESGPWTHWHAASGRVGGMANRAQSAASTCRGGGFVCGVPAMTTVGTTSSPPFTLLT